MQNNENLFLQKLLHSRNQSCDDQLAILMKVQQLTYFNTFIERFLKGSQKDNLLNLCGQLRMEHFRGGEIIFLEGDRSNDKLYIIFNGQVVLHRAKKFEAFSEPAKGTFISQFVVQVLKAKGQDTKKNNPLGKLAQTKVIAHRMIANLSHHHTLENQIISQELHQALIEKYGEVVRILGKGEGFGEAALLQNTPRALTACAYSDDLFLLILKKEQFDMVKTQFTQSLKDKKLLIFSKFQVQNAYSTAMLQSLAYSFEVEQFQYNQMLTIEGKHKNKVFYLIQSGDVLLEQTVDGQTLKVCLLSRGQFVGEEIVFKPDNVYNFNAKVITQSATVMVISKQEFLQKFPDECRSQLKTEYLQKQQVRQTFKPMKQCQHDTEQHQMEIPKIMVQIRVNKSCVRSSERHLTEQEVSSIIRQKQLIYNWKYQHAENCENALPFFSTHRKHQKASSLNQLPDYSKKTNNILVKSLKLTLKKQFRRALKWKDSFAISSSNGDISVPLTTRSNFKIE